MAKIKNPITPALWPVATVKPFFDAGTATQTSRRAMTQRARGNPRPLAVWNAKITEAAAAWRALRFWKRARWSFCGVARGLSGPMLYFTEYIAQGITPGHQPISPCSRRMTDPTASPFDFTP